MKTTSVKPLKDRYLLIQREDWGAQWHFQFPESITAEQGQLLECNPVGIAWQSNDQNTWSYTWESGAEYLKKQRDFMAENPALARKQYVTGLKIEATLAIASDALNLELTLTNNTGHHLSHVVCEGGCLQAKSPSFQTPGELERTGTLMDGRLVRLSLLDHQIDLRSVHHCRKGLDSLPPWKDGEWFWGKGVTNIDFPCVIAMTNQDGDRAIGIGYESAMSICANSDGDHHCIHSCPCFGDMEPGESTTRKGRIVLGDGLEAVLRNLREDPFKAVI